MSPLLAVFWYCCAILCIVLLVLAARRGERHPWLADDRPRVKRQAMEWVAIASAWLMVTSLVLAGLIDLVIWAMGNHVPKVSDWVHYTLYEYPWIGWVAAGLCYHLLIDRPHPPWR